MIEFIVLAAFLFAAIYVIKLILGLALFIIFLSSDDEPSKNKKSIR